MSKDKKRGQVGRAPKHAASKTPPQRETFKFTDADGRVHDAYKLANGTIKSQDTGRFLTPPTTPPYVDKEFAREAALRKHELARQQAIRGLMDAAKDKGLIVASGEEAWGEVIRAMANTALDGGSRQSVRAAQLAGKAAGYLGEESKRVEVQETKRSVHFDTDLLLLRMIANVEGGDEEATLESMAEFKADSAGWLAKRREGAHE